MLAVGDASSPIEVLRAFIGMPELEQAQMADDPRVIAAVDALTTEAAYRPDDAALRHVLGWWHALAESRTSDPIKQAAHESAAHELLLPVYRITPGEIPPAMTVRFRRDFRLAHERVIQLFRELPGDGSADPSLLVDACRSALALTPEGSPNRARLLSNLGSALRIRFERMGELMDLDEAIRVGDAAVAATPDNSPRRAGRLSNLGIALRARFERTAQMKDLDEAVRVGTAALAATSGNRAQRAKVLSNLGLALQARFDRTGQMKDLDEAVQVGTAAVAATPEDDPDRAGRLSNVGAGLLVRFRRTGCVPDLDEAIRACAAAVAASPDSSPHRAGRLSNLGIVLRARFERTGQIADLDEAIRVGADAVEMTPDQSPHRAGRLSNLGVALQARFERTGQTTDLDEAIRVGADAVEATANDSLERAGRLSSLGLALLARYDRARQLADLDEAVDLCAAAVTATPDDHPDRAGWLSNLGSSLLARFRRTGQTLDLDEAVRVGLAALAATPEDSPHWARLLSSLGLAMLARFDRSGHFEDLDEAVRMCTEAVAATPDDTPDRAERLSNLGVALQTRFKQTGQRPDLEAATEAFRKTAHLDVAPPLTVCAAAVAWARLVDDSEAVAAFATAMESLPRVAGWELGWEDAAAQLRAVAGVGREAAAAIVSVAGGDATQAALTFEQGHAVIYSRMLRSRGDLTDLEQIRPDLADRVANSLATLNADGKIVATNTAEVWRRAEAELEQALIEVRSLGKAWSRFFLPPEEPELQRAAESGSIAIINVASRRCDAFIITAEGIKAVPLPRLTQDDAFESANTFLTAVSLMSLPDAAASDRAQAAGDLESVCAWMWDTIAEPVLTAVGHTTPRHDRDFATWPRLWWIPTGPLTLLPLHAAGYHGKAAQGTPGRRSTVIHRVVSSTIPTIDALERARRRSSAPVQDRRALIVGMPRNPHSRGHSVPDLPAVMAEIDTIADHLSRTPQTLMVNGDPTTPVPTRETVLAAIRDHAWTHFACHAYTDPSSPTKSTLLLADNEAAPLTVLDLLRSPLGDPELLYLSACTTARTGLTTLDEPIHFASAALLAGYRHVIATLWPLADDAEPADIIYGTLTSDGRPISWAADQAALAVHVAAHARRNTPGAGIFEWANLTHYGP